MIRFLPLPAFICSIGFLKADPLAFTESFADGVYANGHCVVVGGYRPGWTGTRFLSNTCFIGRSKNLTQWQLTSYGGANGLWSVTHGADHFVAVGEHGLILRSKDRVNWERHHLPDQSEEWLMDVHYADGRFVAVGTKSIHTSINGSRWTKVSTDGNFYGVNHASGLWVAVGYGGKIATSTDGQAWTPQTSGSDFMLRSVAYGRGRWVAVGGEGRHGMLTSTDGKNWNPISSGSNAQLMDIAFIDGAFLLVGGNRKRKQQGTFEYSYDGLNWVTLFDVAPDFLDMICEVPGAWLLGGEGGGILFKNQRLQELAIQSPWEPKENDTAQRWITATIKEGPPYFETTPSPTTPSPPASLEISLPQMEIVVEQGKVRLRWKSSKGQSYRLRRSENLSDWTLLEDRWIGDGEEMRFEEALAPDQTKAFFRLEVLRTDS